MLLHPVLQLDNRQVTYALVFKHVCDWYIKLSGLVVRWPTDQIPEISDTVTLIYALIPESS